MVAAQEGYLIAHDILEHQNGLKSIGSVGDELEALGGVWFVRGEYGDISRRSGYQGTPYDSMKSDLLIVFRDYFYAGAWRKTPSRAVGECREDFEDILDYISNADFLTQADEATGDDLAEFRKMALACMCSGYNKANRRFESQCSANTLFWNIAEQVDQAIKRVWYAGQQFRLYYSYDRVTIDEVYESYED